MKVELSKEDLRALVTSLEVANEAIEENGGMFTSEKQDLAEQKTLNDALRTRFVDVLSAESLK